MSMMPVILGDSALTLAWATSRSSGGPDWIGTTIIYPGDPSADAYQIQGAYNDSRADEPQAWWFPVKVNGADRPDGGYTGAATFGVGFRFLDVNPPENPAAPPTGWNYDTARGSMWASPLLNTAPTGAYWVMVECYQLTRPSNYIRAWFRYVHNAAS